MHYAPNVDAAFHLIRDVFPVVRVEIPDAQLHIVGRDPTPELRAAQNVPGVTIIGFVEDVRPWLEGATVFASPIRFGAGIQNKVLEAMAMELPVVASTVAADGLRTNEGTMPPVDIADDPSQWLDSSSTTSGRAKIRPLRFRLIATSFAEIATGRTARN